MAMSPASAASGEDEQPKNIDRKVSAPPAGAEVRRSMVKLARLSISQAPRSSRLSTPALAVPIRPHPDDSEASPSEASEGTEGTEPASPMSNETRKSLQEVSGEATLNPFYRLQIIGFLTGLLDRLSLLLQLPEACKIADSTINIKHNPEEQDTLKAKEKLLAAANLVHYTLPHPIKVSKFEIEAKWLQSILTAALHEVANKSSFEILNKVVEEDAAMQQSLPDAIEHTKALKEKIEIMKMQIKGEADAHVETIREWNKNLTLHKQELKEMRKQQRIAYKYKADKALAAGDCARRDREVKLAEARAENVRLKADTEREKLVHAAVMDYMGKQNMALREEVLDLTAIHENDMQCLDWCLDRMETQIKEKKLAIEAIEPEYKKEMEELAKAEAEANRKHEEWYANLGYSELSLKSAYIIQKIWRGYLVRKIWGKVLRKLRKKRLAAAKKKKKK